MFKKLLLIHLSLFLFATANAGLEREIELAFEEVEGASQYEIEITSSNKDFKTIKQVNSSPAWKITLSPGQYTLRSRSFDNRKVAGPWGGAQEFEILAPAVEMVSPKKKEKIIAKDKEKEEITFVWQAIEGIKDYKIEIQGDDFEKTDIVSEVGYQLSLDVAKSYRWRVVAVDNDEKIVSQLSDFQKFGLWGAKVNKPEIEVPSGDLIKVLEWRKPEFAESYTWSLQRKNKKGKWKTVKKAKSYTSEEIKFEDSWKGGDYRLAVRAKAKGRASSDVAKLEFKAMGGKRRLAAIEKSKLKDSLEKKSDYFFIASYLITSMQYQGQFLEARKVNFPAVGGTGRLGLGYSFKKSKWGMYGIVDLSGFDIAGQRYTFPAAEFHSVYKTYWKDWMIRSSGGLFAKYLPEVTGDVGSGVNLDVQTVGTLGPHLGVDFWRAFTPKYGLQLSGRMYINSLGLSTPADEGIESSGSFQFSAYGSYKISDSMMGLAGYAYRVDEIRYGADPNAPDPASGTGAAVGEGVVNTINVSGHYLNLILEWGF